MLESSVLDGGRFSRALGGLGGAGGDPGPDPARGGAAGALGARKGAISRDLAMDLGILILAV